MVVGTWMEHGCALRVQFVICSSVRKVGILSRWGIEECLLRERYRPLMLKLARTPAFKRSKAFK